MALGWPETGEPREGGGENDKARAEEGPGDGVALPDALVEVVLSRDEPPEFPRVLFREEVPLAVRFRS